MSPVLNMYKRQLDAIHNWIWVACFGLVLSSFYGWYYHEIDNYVLYMNFAFAATFGILNHLTLSYSSIIFWIGIIVSILVMVITLKFSGEKITPYWDWVFYGLIDYLYKRGEIVESKLEDLQSE